MYDFLIILIHLIICGIGLFLLLRKQAVSLFRITRAFLLLLPLLYLYLAAIYATALKEKLAVGWNLAGYTLIFILLSGAFALLFLLLLFQKKRKNG